MAFATIRGWSGAPLAAAALIFLGTAALAAEPEPAAEPAAEPHQADKPIEADPSEPPKQLLGDMGGLRTALAARGVELGVTYIGELFGTVSGGIKRGVVYDGQVGVAIDVDLEKFAGWTGANFRVNAINIHGRGPSANLVGNLMAVSSIEALSSTRLYQLYLDQKFFDDRVSIRVGQLASDAEFFISDTSAALVNGTFGWPLLTAANMTSGGPGYPLPTPGIRLQLKPFDDFTFRGAVFSGNPAGGGCTTSPQICNRDGTTFSFSGGALWLAELEYGVNKEKGSPYLPGTYKLGGWRQTGANFTHQLTGANLSGDWGIYAIADQGIWRRTPGEDQGINVFMRMGGAPSDRNLVTWYVDGGFGFKGPLVERPDDVLTLGIAYGRISDDAALADRLAGPPTPVRDKEMIIELSYNISVIPGWTLQPDLQYIIHPGGNVLKPSGAGRIQDALVLGVRSTFNF